MIRLINLLGPSVFWTTLVVICATLTMATLIGSVWVNCFPKKLRSAAKFYLSPVLGLASLTIVASLIGRFLPLGDSIVVVLIVSTLLASVLLRRFFARPSLHQLAATNLFGIVCGTSVLVPLYVYGGYNASNDAFTYLVHGDWLQHHAFNEYITSDTITPLNSQVAIYQHAGFRMGASYLLALIQAVLNFRWTYEVYPGVIIAAIAACCLTIGFPLSRWLCTMSRPVQLALLTLPALSLGGLVFGANLGFLPQTVGLAFGAGVLFWIGPIFRWISLTKSSLSEIGIAALPGAILFSAAIFAYSEFGPFLVLAIGGSGLLLALKSKSWKQFLALTGTLFILSALLLNTEILRAMAALQTQSSAVVGSPVDWSLLGYFAHSLGVHGGAWDDFQWTLPQSSGTVDAQYGLAALASVLTVVLLARRTIWAALRTGVLLPVAIILIVFTLALLYFRYAVPSPFDKGIGQSWSQFKLADWAHPFTMALIILAFASLKRVLRRSFIVALVPVLTISTIASGSLGISRIQPFVQSYPGVSNFNSFYLNLRNTVLSECRRDASVYLALEAEHHKFRQMAALYLYDREVKSDWMDDGYIFQSLPIERRTQGLAIGDCIVEPASHDGWISQGTIIGSVRIGAFNRLDKIRIASTTGTYGRETDGKNWWYWVEKRISFKMPLLPLLNESIKTNLKFEYQTSGERQVTLKIIMHDGTSKEIDFESDGKRLETFQQEVEILPSDISEFTLETSGIPTPLGNGDSRAASILIRNVSINAILASK